MPNNKKPVKANKTVKVVKNPLGVVPKGMGTGLFNKSFVQPKKPLGPKRRTRRRSSRTSPRIMYE